MIRLLTLTLLFASALAFAPPSPTRSAVSLRMSDSATEVSAFDAYEQNDSQALAFNDVKVGSGDAVESGKLITVKYEARLMQSGKKFDFSEGYVFRLGDGKVLPGWEKGLLGMKVGGERVLRIPPSLAYGDDWFKGTIPPKSHLEFDLELLNIAQTPQEEMMVQLEDFGIGRLLGLIACFGILAITPLLPQ